MTKGVVAAVLLAAFVACPTARAEEAAEAKASASRRLDERTQAEVSAMIQRGTRYAEEGKYGQAIDELTGAIKLDPTRVDAHRLLVAVMARLGEIDRVISDYEDITASHPEDVAAHCALAYAYVQKGPRMYESAAEEYQRAIELDPGDFYAQAGLGWVYVQLGRYEEALIPLEQAIMIDPDQDGPFVDLWTANYKLLEKARADGDAAAAESIRRRLDDLSAWRRSIKEEKVVASKKVLGGRLGELVEEWKKEEKAAPEAKAEARGAPQKPQRRSRRPFRWPWSRRARPAAAAVAPVAQAPAELPPPPPEPGEGVARKAVAEAPEAEHAAPSGEAEEVGRHVEETEIEDAAQAPAELPPPPPEPGEGIGEKAVAAAPEAGGVEAAQAGPAAGKKRGFLGIFKRRKTATPPPPPAEEGKAAPRLSASDRFALLVAKWEREKAAPRPAGPAKSPAGIPGGGKVVSFDEGVATVVITEGVKEMGDRIAVTRDGEKVAEVAVSPRAVTVVLRIGDADVRTGDELVLGDGRIALGAATPARITGIDGSTLTVDMDAADLSESKPAFKLSRGGATVAQGRADGVYRISVVMDAEGDVGKVRPGDEVRLAE